MDTVTIRKLLKTFKCFKGVFPCDQRPYSTKLPLNIIVNTDPSYKPGEHWISISINKQGKGEYFDSFGLPPIVDDIIKFLEYNCSSGWTYNKKTLQNITSQTCGNYCVLYIIFKCQNYSLRSYLAKFSAVSIKNDKKIQTIFKNFSLVRKFFKRKD